MNNDSSRFPGRGRQTEFIVVLLLSTCLMGSSFVAGKILLQDGFPALLLVGWRFFVAALATLPLTLLEGKPVQALFPSRARMREFGLVIAIGVLQTAAVMGLLFLAMTSISASTAAILLFTNPIWVALLGRVLLGESLPKTRVLGLLLGVVGVGFAIGVGPDLLSGDGQLAGELTGLASSLCWACATLLNKRTKLPYGPWALSFWQMLIGSFVLLGLAYGLGQRWPDATSIEQWGWFTWLAIPASTGSFGLWFVALRTGGATRTSSFLFVAPLFTVVLSFFILGTTLAWPQALGGALIGLALWLINRRTPEKADAESRPGLRQ